MTSLKSIVDAASAARYDARMLVQRALAVAACLTAVLASAGLSSAASGGEGRAPLPAGSKLRIVGITSEVYLTRASGNDVTVRASFTGPDAARFALRIEHDASGVTICDVRRDDAGASCDRQSDRNDRKATARFDVGVPSGARVDASVVDGRIEARGIDATLTASTVDGPIDVDATQIRSLHTVNGPIAARLTRAPSQPISIGATSGDIDLNLPRGAYGLSATSVSGRISSSSTQIAVSRNFVGSTAAASLGGGGPEISIATVSGHIAMSLR